MLITLAIILGFLVRGRNDGFLYIPLLLKGSLLNIFMIVMGK